VADTDKLGAALAAIDAANAADPNEILVGGERRPKELAHAELASAWLARLVDTPSEALQLAVRAHHICRWESPRSTYPEGRVGYHKWRRDLQMLHAERVGQILAEQSIEEGVIARVQALVRKQGLGRDVEVQALEDAVCLVFLELQLHALAARLEEHKLLDIVRKTLVKMSEKARALAAELPLAKGDAALIERAALR